MTPDSVRVLVVDASVVLKWYRAEVQSEAAVTLLQQQLSFHAPEILAGELVSALWKWSRAGVITQGDADWLLYDWRRFPFKWHSNVDLMDDAAHLAVNGGHPVYDCFYLALARRLRCRCVTADRRFYDRFSAAYPEALLWVEDVPA